MSPPIQMNEVLKLPVDERLRIIEMIWDSIADHPEAVPLTDAQEAEVARRIENYRRHPERTSSLEEVKARLAKRPGEQ